MLKHQWKVEVHHVYRESNKVADALASLGHGQLLGVVYFCSCPAYLVVILCDDMASTAMPRFIL